MVRHLGPISVAPAVTVLKGSRLIDLSLFSDPTKVMDAATDQCSGVDGDIAAFLVRT